MAELCRHRSKSASRAIADRGGPEVWQEAADAMPVIVLVLDDTGRVVRANRRACAVLGLEPVDVGGVQLPTSEPWLSVRRALESATTGRCFDTHVVETLSFEARVAPMSTNRFVAWVEPVRATAEGSAEGHALLARTLERIAHQLRNHVFALTANLEAFALEPEPASAVPTYLPLLIAETERLAARVRDLTNEVTVR